VIARDLGALPEVIHDSGVCVYRNDEELLAAIGRITSSPRLRHEVGEKRYRAFVQRWTREAHLDLYYGYLRKAARFKLNCVLWEQDEEWR